MKDQLDWLSVNLYRILFMLNFHLLDDDRLRVLQTEVPAAEGEVEVLDLIVLVPLKALLERQS